MLGHYPLSGDSISGSAVIIVAPLFHAYWCYQTTTALIGGGSGVR